MAGIYIHIPFCRQACVYCNFYFKTGTRQMEEVVAAICREIVLRKGETLENIETIYFGGGTPSFVPVQAIADILKTIQSHYSIETIKELTLEANPDDITAEKLKQWKALGVNRLSIGVQSFFEDDLRWMNRAHTAAEAEQCIQLALAENFEVSVDLIFGLPVSNNEKWASNLEKVNAMGVHHLSCYGLTLEENTGWKKLIERKKYVGPDELLTAGQFETTMQYLAERGWQQYEISNYCRPGYMARHNTAYWQGKPYLGFGPAAHSFNGVERSWNVSDNLAYMQALSEDKLPSEREILTDENKVNEYLMTGLRTQWGIDMGTISAMGFDASLLDDRIAAYVLKGLLRKDDQHIVLTNSGKLYADAIAADLFY